MKTIYAPSYSSILFAMENFPTNEIQIVSASPSVISFCEHVKLPVFSLERNEDLSMEGLRSHKAKLDQWLKQWEGAEVYFTFTGFDVWGVYLMEQMRAKNKVHFVNRDPIYPIKNSVLNALNKAHRNALFKQAIYRKVIKYRFDIFELNTTHYFLGTGIEKLNKRFRPFESKGNKELLNKNIDFVLSHYAVPEFDVLLFDTECVDFKFQDGAIDRLKKMLVDNGLKVAVKPHPNFTPKGDLFSGYPVIEKLVPVEFLVGKDKLALGVYSGALNFFVGYQSTISLFNFIDIEPKEYREKIYTDLKAIDGLIMPENWEELERVLKLSSIE